MSLVFVGLKALRIWDTPYDWPMFLGLTGLDHLALIGWLRYWELRRRR